MNLCLKLGVETMEAIILIILGGRHCKMAIGLVLICMMGRNLTLEFFDHEQKIEIMSCHYVLTGYDWLYLPKISDWHDFSNICI